MKTVYLDPWNPRQDLVEEAAEALRRGQLVAMPTDTAWGVFASALQGSAVNKLTGLRSMLTGDPRRSKTDRKPMSLICSSLAQVGVYAQVDQPQFRLLKRILPGPYTVILPASREVPRKIQSKRKTVGIRMPANVICEAICEAVGEPLIGTTARRRDGLQAETSSEIVAAIPHELDVLVDTEPFTPSVSTVLDCTQGHPIVIRSGAGPLEADWEIPDES